MRLIFGLDVLSLISLKTDIPDQKKSKLTDITEEVRAQSQPQSQTRWPLCSLPYDQIHFSSELNGTQ